jgi:hypothetical protein
MDLKEIKLEGLDWIDLSQDMDLLRSLVNAVITLRFT